MGLIFQAIGALLLLVFVSAFFDGFWDFVWWNLKLLLIGGAGIVLIGFIASKWNETYESVRLPRIREAEDKCAPIIQAHLTELRRKQRQLVVDRGYGVKEHKLWNQEKQFFIDNVLRRDPVALIALGELGDAGASELIDRLVSDVPTDSKDSEPLADDPLGYEQFCADLLQRYGWDVSTTRASGDQGADILARKYGRTVVVQCKQYSKPVGNKAIQEAFAARTHYGADAAVVVSNARFTNAAKQLAASTGVLLLHHEQLPSL